jgi:hypothetical protein
MLGYRPRLVYLYSDLAQRDIHHIRCRELLAALETEFDVIQGWALSPRHSIRAGSNGALQNQLLPETVLFEAPASVLYIEGQVAFGLVSDDRIALHVDSKVRRQVLADYFDQGGITILDLFSEPLFIGHSTEQLLQFQQYLHESRLPSLHLTASASEFSDLGLLSSDGHVKNLLPHAVDNEHVVAPGIFRVEVTPSYLQRIHPSLHSAYSGVSRLLLNTPQPVMASTRKPLLAGNPNSTRFLADDWNGAPPVFGVLNDSGNGLSVTITGAPFYDRVLGAGSSDAVRFGMNLLMLLLDEQRRRRPYLGLPDTIETLRWQVPPDADEPTIAAFAHKVHDAIDDARMPEWALERAENSVRSALRDCWTELETRSHHRLRSGEAFFQLFRRVGEISFSGAIVEYAGAVEIELETKLFQKFREHLAGAGRLARLVSSRKDTLAKYLDPAQDWNLTLGAMCYILKQCAERRSTDPLLGALDEFLDSRCEDPGFWLERLPGKLERVIELRNGAAHKSTVSIGRFEEFRVLALGLQDTGLICEIVSQAPRATA